MHDSGTLCVLSLTESRGNIDVRHGYSIDCVHRPSSRRYFRVSLDKLNTAHCTFTFSNPTSCTIHPSSSRVRSSFVSENCRWTFAMEKYPYFTNGTRSQSVSTIYLRTDYLRGLFISRGTNSRFVNVKRPDDRRIGKTTDQGRGTSSMFGTRRYIASTRRMHRRADDEKKNDRGREREKEGEVSADARRLGTRVRRPTEARFGCQSTPHPKLDSSSSNESAVSVGSPSGTGVDSGMQRVGRGKCGAPAPGESARRDGDIRCTWYRYLPLGTLSFYGAYLKRDTNERNWYRDDIDKLIRKHAESFFHPRKIIATDDIRFLITIFLIARFVILERVQYTLKDLRLWTVYR